MQWQYRCRLCGWRQNNDWLGPCSSCGRRCNTKRVAPDASVDGPAAFVENEVMTFQDAVKFADEVTHIESGLEGFDYVLGGGLVQNKGQLVLLTGDPGSGKSTLLIQAFQALAKRRESVLYVSGEETFDQLGGRAKLLGDFHPGMRLVCGDGQIELRVVLDRVEEVKPQFVAIDSVQSIFVDDDYATGSATSIKIVLRQLLKFAKEEKISVVIIGHVNQEGGISGPRTLEHMVDTAVHLEGNGIDPRRTLRCDRKNRFGPAPRKSQWLMTGHGLVHEFNEPEAFAP